MTPALCGGRHRVFVRVDILRPPAQRQELSGRSAAQAATRRARQVRPITRTAAYARPRAECGPHRRTPGFWARCRPTRHAGRRQGARRIARHERKWWSQAASEHGPRATRAACRRSPRRPFDWGPNDWCPFDWPPRSSLRRQARGSIRWSPGTALEHHADRHRPTGASRSFRRASQRGRYRWPRPSRATRWSGSSRHRRRTSRSKTFRSERFRSERFRRHSWPHERSARCTRRRRQRSPGIGRQEADFPQHRRQQSDSQWHPVPEPALPRS